MTSEEMQVLLQGLHQGEKPIKGFPFLAPQRSHISWELEG